VEILQHRSVGFLAVTSANGTDQVAVGSTAVGVKAGTTGTGVMLATGKLQVSASNGTTQATDVLVISVSGGTLSGANSEAATAQPALTYNSSATAVSMAANANSNNSMSVTVTPNAGATSMSVSAWKGANATAAAPSLGTLLGTWSITLTSAAATNTYSPSLSLLALATSTAAQITTNVDASTASISAGNPYYIQVIGKNPYNQALTGGTYVATATNGALLNWGDSAANAVIVAGTLSVATKTPDGTDQLRIDPASSLTTSTTTVTITHDGNVISTKTLTFYGEAKKIVIEKVVPGTITTAIAGNGATAYAIYSYRDSADGKVPGAAATFVASSATSTVPTGGSARNPSRSSTAAAGNPLLAAVATLVGPGQDGVFAFTCGATPGKASPSIAHTNAITGATLTAEVKDLGCYGPIATYTVSMDKASYAVGDIATITIEGKDAAGNPVSDAQLVGAGTISVGGGDLTVAVGATDVFTAGKATYKAQIKTAGKFNTVVSIAGSVTTSATATYTVTDGAISNAEVLASIVKLIAAINKQIRALQKSLRR